MKYKGENCFSIDRAELLEVLKLGGVIRWWNCGPMIYDPHGEFPHKELHPRRDTVLRLIEDGTLANTSKVDANETQRQCGLSTYRLASLVAAGQGAGT